MIDELKRLVKQLESGEIIVLASLSELEALIPGAVFADILPEIFLSLDHVRLEQLTMTLSEDQQTLTSVSFIIGMDEWMLLPSIPLSVKQVQLNLIIPIPFAKSQVSGRIEGQAFMGAQHFPRLTAALPSDLDDFTIKMVDNKYPLPSLNDVQPLLGSFDLSSIFPTNFPELSHLLLSNLHLRFDRAFDGFNYVEFVLWPKSDLPDQAPTWTLLPGANSLRMKISTLRCHFPPFQFQVEGLIELNEKTLPMMTTFTFGESTPTNQLTLALEELVNEETLLPQTYSLDGPDLDLIGINLADMLPGLSRQIPLSLSKLKLTFTTGNPTRLTQMSCRLQTNSVWPIIPQRINLNELDISLMVNFGQPAFQNWTLESEVTGRVRLEGLDPMTMRLTIPSKGSWRLSSHFSDRVNGIPISGISPLKVLSVNNLPDMVPQDKGLVLDAVNLTYFEIDLMPLPQQQLLRTLFELNITTPWQIAPDIKIRDLKLHLQTSFITETPSVSFQFSGTINRVGLSVPILVNKESGDQWVVETGPEWQANLSFAQFSELLKDARLGEVMTEALSMQVITLFKYALGFRLHHKKGAELRYQNLEIEIPQWQIAPVGLTFKDVKYQLEISQSKLRQQIYASIVIEDFFMPVLIEQDQQKWRVALDQEIISAKWAFPLSKLKQWLGGTLVDFSDLVAFGEVRLANLEMHFDNDWKEWKTLSFTGEIGQHWTPTLGFLAIKLKKLEVEVLSPFNPAEREIAYKVDGTTLIGSKTANVTIEIPNDTSDWTLSIGSTVNEITLEEIGDLLGNEAQLHPLLNALPGNLNSIAMKLNKLIITFNKQTNRVTEVLLETQCYKAEFPVKIPVVFEHDKVPPLDFSSQLLFTGEKMIFELKEGNWGLNSEATLSIQQLPGNIQEQLPDKKIHVVFQKEGNVLRLSNAKKDKNIGTVNIPSVEIAGQRVDVDLQIKDFLLEWSIVLAGEPALASNINILLPSQSITLQELPGDILKKTIPFYLRVNSTQGLSAQLLTWPLTYPMLREEGGWTYLDFGDYGEIRFKLPNFHYDGINYAAKGEVEQTKPLHVPLAFIKNYLTKSGLAFLASLFPDTVPLTPQITLRDHITTSGGDPDALPLNFQEYLTLQVPDRIAFDITTQGSTAGIHFDFQVKEDENDSNTEPKPLKLLIPNAPPFLVGIKLWRIGLGEIKGWMMLDVDVEIDLFNLPLLIALSHWKLQTPPLLPSPEDIHLKLEARKLTTVLVGGFFPVPLFFDKLSLSYLGIEGLRLETKWTFPMPQINITDIVAIIRLLPQLIKFLTDPSYFLDPNSFTVDDLEMVLSIESAYAQLPTYLNNTGLGHQGDSLHPLERIVASKTLAHLLNVQKRPRPQDLLELIPLGRRNGPDSVTFGPLTTGSDWVVTTAKEYREQNPTNLPANIVDMLLSTEKDGLLLLMGGRWDKQASFLVTADVLLGMSLQGFSGAGLHFAVKGTLGNAFIAFDLVGSTVLDLADQHQPLRLTAKGNFKVGDVDIYRCDVQLHEKAFAFEGQANLINTFWFKAGTRTMTGLLEKSGKLMITGRVDATDGNFPLIDLNENYAKGTITNDRVSVKGAFSLLDSPLLRLAGAAEVILERKDLFNVINLSGKLVGSSGLLGLATGNQGVSVLGENLGDPDSRVTITGHFTILDTGLLKLDGEASATYDADKNISLTGHLTYDGNTGLLGLTSGLSIIGHELKTPSRKVMIEGNYTLIDQPLLSIKGNAILTLDNSNLSLAGRVIPGGLLKLTDPEITIGGEQLLDNGRKISVHSRFKIIDKPLLRLRGSALLTLNDNNLALIGGVDTGGQFKLTNPEIQIKGEQLLDSDRKIMIHSRFEIINQPLLRLTGDATLTLDDTNLWLSGDVEAGGLLKLTDADIEIEGKRLLDASREITLRSRFTLIDYPLLRLKGNSVTVTLNDDNLLLTGVVTSTGFFELTDANITLTGERLLDRDRKVTLHSHFKMIDQPLLRLKGDVTLTLNDNNLSLKGAVIGEKTGVLNLTKQNIEVKGENLLSAERQVQLESDFFILETPLIRLGGRAKITLDDKQLAVSGKITGAQGFFQLATSGATQVRVSASYLTATSTTFMIQGSYGIDTPLLKVGGSINGTVNYQKHLDLSGNIAASAGAFSLSGGGVEVSANHLTLASNWLGFSVELSYDKNRLTGQTQSQAFSLGSLNLGPINMPNPLGGHFSIDPISMGVSFEGSINNLVLDGDLFSGKITGRIKYNSHEQAIFDIPIDAVPTSLAQIKQKIIDEISKNNGQTYFQHLYNDLLAQEIERLKNTLLTQYNNLIKMLNSLKDGIGDINRTFAELPALVLPKPAVPAEYEEVDEWVSKATGGFWRKVKKKVKDAVEAVIGNVDALKKSLKEINDDIGALNTAIISKIGEINGVVDKLRILGVEKPQETFTSFSLKSIPNLPAYISTAICREVTQSEDSRELRIVRQWWGMYVWNSADGDEIIHSYHIHAPKIVTAIYREQTCSHILMKLYEVYLRECIQYIEAGKHGEALTIYMTMVHDLEMRFLADTESSPAAMMHQSCLGTIEKPSLGAKIWQSHPGFFKQTPLQQETATNMKSDHDTGGVVTQDDSNPIITEYKTL